MKCLNDLLQSSTKRPNVLRKRVVLSKGTAVSFGTVYVLFSNSCCILGEDWCYGRKIPHYYKCFRARLKPSEHGMHVYLDFSTYFFLRHNPLVFFRARCGALFCNFAAPSLHPRYHCRFVMSGGVIYRLHQITRVSITLHHNRSRFTPHCSKSP